jgi:hypothetical protein
MRRKLALLVVGLGAAFGIAEVGWRIGEAFGWVGSVVPRAVGQFDPYLGWSLKRGAIAVSKRTGSAVEYRINSKGLRDDEHAYEKPGGIFRIVLVGDSNTFGVGVPIEQHFSTLLERSFRAPEVINLGVSGYGVDQAFLRLQIEGFKYAPDLVIAYVPYYNQHNQPRHMHTRRFGKNKPRFVLVQGELRLAGVPVQPPMIFQSSCIVRFLEASLQRIGDAREQADAAFRRETIELGDALVMAMDEASRRHGAQFLLVTKNPWLHHRMVKRGVRWLNVQSVLNDPTLRLPRGLWHLNEDGNRVLASAIAGFLQREGLIPARHLMNFTTQTAQPE